MKPTERTELGQEIETALEEVLAHLRGEQALPCRIVDDPCGGSPSRRCPVAKDPRPRP